MLERKRYGRNRFDDGEEVNPMNYLSNLSDVMLIFAVGMMVALIMHWGVDVSVADTLADVDADTRESEAYAEYEEIDPTSAAEFTEEDRQRMKDNAVAGEIGDGMEKTGEVYYDANTDTYYIVENGTADEEEEP